MGEEQSQASKLFVSDGFDLLEDCLTMNYATGSVPKVSILTMSER